MQHGPSMITIVIFFLVLAGIAWLGERILAKWQLVYSGKKARATYWLVTVLAVVLLALGRWLQPQGELAGEVFRYFIYVAYCWLTGLVFMLIFLLAAHCVRLFGRKLGQQGAEPKAARPITPPTGQPESLVTGSLTRRQFLQGAITAVPAIPFAVSTYGVIGGDNTIVVNKHNLTFPQLPAELDGFTIAQISDTHIGTFFGMDKLDKVLAMVKKEQPQLLVITGDLIDEIRLLVPTMERLTAFHAGMPYGTVFCWGNHEYFRDINRIRQALYNSPITVLENNHKLLVPGMYLAGVDYPWGKNKDEMAAKREAYFSQALSGIPGDAFTVLLAHHPDFFDDAFKAGVPLSLAGHTHGGQVAIAGTSLLPVQYKYMKGMYRQDNCYGYVSAGTGHWLPLRIGCPAEVSFFTLKRGLL